MKSDDHPGIPAGQQSEWFHERYEGAARQILEFLADGSVLLTGRDVADIGCGDGIIDLGIAAKARPRALTGYDIRPVDIVRLSRLAAQEATRSDLPANLNFVVASAYDLPARDASFDVVFSWSSFQYLADVPAALREARRVLRPQGALMIHLYPFFHSRHGSLLEPWFPDGWAHLLHTGEEIEARVLSDPGPDPGWARQVLALRRRANRITLEGLHRAIRDQGYRVSQLELIAGRSELPPEVSGLPLWQTGVEGVNLVARPE